MSKLILSNVVLFVFLSLIQNNDVFSWDNEVTHRDLSKYAADNSVLSKNNGDYLKNLGFNLGLNEVFVWQGKNWTVTKWLREGSFLEDEGSYLDAVSGTARYSNHFHNPLKVWGSAGLSDLQNGESTVLWAQDSSKQSVSLGGDWSWQKIRLCYYNALKVQNEADRQTFFACTFEGLGYQMHLVEDMSVPSHTRNDAHPLDSLVGTNYETGDYYLETWAKKNYSKINSFASSPAFPQVALNANHNGRLPIAQFIDSEQYNGTMPSTSLTWGLSEYTNSNFLSDDTIFTEDKDINDKHYFPYPRYSTNSYEMFEVQNSLITKRIYLKKKGDGEQVEHFATAGPLYKWLTFDPVLQKTELKLDPTVFNDYTSNLIPRAVGYSAGLINYFFRGSITITIPSNSLYSTADDRNIGFTRITLLAVNPSTNADEMTDGSIELVARYRTVQSDPFQSFDIQASNDYTYVVVPEATGKRSIPKGTPAALVFDRGQTAIIPVNAVDVSLQIVYHGTLGNETGAVAVGLKTISDPTPVECVNNMDKVCLNGQWYNAASPEATAQVDPDNNGIPNWDIYSHDLTNIYIKISPANYPVQASASDFTFSSAILNPRNLLRAFILGDPDSQINHSLSMTVVKTTSADTFTHASDIFNGIWPGYIIKSQIESSSDTAVCNLYGFATPCTVRHAPAFYSFRGLYMWGPTGVIFDNPKYPIDTSCDWKAL